jgi:hypothetical protein
MALRSDAYRHLREVAARGWSFWDVFSFRERMARFPFTPFLVSHVLEHHIAGHPFVVISS